MKGWKTWFAAISSIAYGVGGLVGGLHDSTTAMGFVTGGLAMIGLGHKIEKIGK